MYIVLVRERHPLGHFVIRAAGVASNDREYVDLVASAAVLERGSSQAWVMEFDPPDYVPPLKLVRDSKEARA